MPQHSSIPDFGHGGLLPPTVGDPTRGANHSPYRTIIEEVITRFATSSFRCKILRGFVEYRKLLFLSGIVTGIQWLDGSFTQLLDREPNDIDVVSFFYDSDHEAIFKKANALPTNPFDQALVKRTLLCDSYPTYLAGTMNDIRLVTFWYGLFTHTRENVWKGILEIPLQTDLDETVTMLQLIDKMEANHV